MNFFCPLLTVFMLTVLVQSRPQTIAKENMTANQLRSEEICAMMPLEGSCLAFSPKFFYNSKVGRCEIFFYSGCGGNPNRFENKGSCQSFCRQFLK